MDTIAAVATPPGKGAIGVVRLSGRDAENILRLSLRLAKGDLEARKVFMGAVYERDGTAIDRVLYTWFEKPRSYTGEDLAEISCHGSPWVQRRILERLLELGARLAEPGEFTQRAFLNGKMDLVQAEAVRDLIDSQTVHQASLARNQLEGRLEREVRPIRSELVEAISHLETRLEFVEEDVAPAEREELVSRVGRVVERLRRVEEGFEMGRVVREGARVVLAGRPNVGKSSIFNALLLDERAIVTEWPGTTRDSLREALDLKGLPVWLVDTAGMRAAGNAIEELGLEQAARWTADADLILFVVDWSGEFEEADWMVWDAIRTRPYLLVENKSDLVGRAGELPPAVVDCSVGRVRVSARERENLESLTNRVRQALLPEGGAELEGALISNVRQKNCVEEAAAAAERGLAALRQGESEEYVSHDLRKVLLALESLVGKTSNEEILGKIFSTFCVGK